MPGRGKAWKKAWANGDCRYAADPDWASQTRMLPSRLSASLSLPLRYLVRLSWYDCGQNHPGFARGVNAKRKGREGGLLSSGTEMPGRRAQPSKPWNSHKHMNGLIFVWVSVCALCYTKCVYVCLSIYVYVCIYVSTVKPRKLEHHSPPALKVKYKGS